jgi:aldehyde:ferredoxin oxidoreductase
MYGWMGVILRVNLTTGTLVKEALNLKDAKDFIGARGLGTKIFCDEVSPKWTRLAREQDYFYDRTSYRNPGRISRRYNVVTKGR